MSVTTSEGRGRRKVSLLDHRPDEQPPQTAPVTADQVLAAAPDTPLQAKPLFSQLSERIRVIGEEETAVGSEETRLDRAVRALYRSAGKGEASSARLLFERGWGNVPNVNVNADQLTTDALQAMLGELGLTVEQASEDPLLNSLFRALGVPVVKNESRPETLTSTS